jgi:hypothetical protein
MVDSVFDGERVATHQHSPRLRVGASAAYPSGAVHARRLDAFKSIIAGANACVRRLIEFR